MRLLLGVTPAGLVLLSVTALALATVCSYSFSAAGQFSITRIGGIASSAVT